MLFSYLLYLNSKKFRNNIEEAEARIDKDSDD